MSLAYHITIDQALTVLFVSASIATILADMRAQDRKERSAQLQHAAYELGLQVARDRTPASA